MICTLYRSLARSHTMLVVTSWHWSRQCKHTLHSAHSHRHKTERSADSKNTYSYNFLVYMNLFVLSGLSTNIPIGFFFCFCCSRCFMVIWVSSWTVALYFCRLFAGFLAPSTLQCSGYGAMHSALVHTRSTRFSTVSRTRYDWHISHHFPAFCLLTLFRFCYC